MGGKMAETYVTVVHDLDMAAQQTSVIESRVEILATNDDDVVVPSGRSPDLIAGKTSMMSMVKNLVEIEIEIDNVITTMD
ncbi:unnamed protein product [Spirodela intermedia]|uniref:Uncharacterized protein n=1 Tax=Spirodela intermedia TaxID=51605 RepID=A0A7I8L239_SPIIN|nr:unnamed protein product [Spirodela intermedia]